MTSIMGVGALADVPGANPSRARQRWRFGNFESIHASTNP